MILYRSLLTIIIFTLEDILFYNQLWFFCLPDIFLKNAISSQVFICETSPVFTTTLVKIQQSPEMSPVLCYFSINPKVSLITVWRRTSKETRLCFSCTGNLLHGDFVLLQVELRSASLSIIQVEMVITLCLRSVCSLIVGFIQHLHSGSINAHAIDFLSMRSPGLNVIPSCKCLYHRAWNALHLDERITKS